MKHGYYYYHGSLFIDSPRVRLVRDGGDVYVLKSSSFSLSCEVKSNPVVSSVTWKKQTLGLNNNGNRYTETLGITSNTNYSCTATNDIGSAEASINMIVHCKFTL